MVKLAESPFDNQQHTCGFTGRECEHKATCLNGKYAVDCWQRTCYEESQPEGRDTGRHRDSMG